MATAKKLIFAPIFAISLIVLISQLPPLLESSDLIFSLSLATLTQLITISILISLSSLLFVLFASLTLDWKIILPVGLLVSLSSLIFLEPAIGIVFAVGVFVSLLVSFLSLENTLKSYLTFQPNTLFGPSIRHLSSFLILVIAITYFLAVNKVIAQNGFQIPDSLIDTTLQFAQPKTDQQDTPQLSIPQDLSNDLIKSTVNDQIQNLIKPYLNFIPAILALLLFFTLQSLNSLINLFIAPLIWLIFLVLEKSGFIKFTTEMRPVKKMVL